MHKNRGEEEDEDERTEEEGWRMWWRQKDEGMKRREE